MTDLDLGAPFLAALAAYVPRQRWFASKGKGVGSLEVPAASRLDDGLWAVALRAGDTTYEMVVGARPLGDAPDHGVIARLDDGTCLFEALFDARSALRILELMADGAERDGVRFTVFDAVEPNVGTARPAGAEQSNTSVIFGDRYILKWIRRPAQGTNPEVEVTAALADYGFPNTVRPFAVAERDGATIAVLQELLVGAEDAWPLATAAAGRDEDIDAERLGRVTAELHVALGEVFGAGEVGDGERADWVQAMRLQLARTVAQSDVADLEDRRERIEAVFAGVRSVADPGRQVRIHGDYHLGQVMRQGGRWIILDFEGEPALPLEERVRPTSPLADVAGMLRSFDYAAAVGGGRPEWIERQRDAFLAGYRAVAQPAGLVPGGGDFDVVLSAFELRKAVYEVGYEASSRPDWVEIPLAAVRRLTELG